MLVLVALVLALVLIAGADAGAGADAPGGCSLMVGVVFCSLLLLLLSYLALLLLLVVLRMLRLLLWRHWLSWALGAPRRAEVVDAADTRRAAELFRRDGFVAVAGLVPPQQARQLFAEASAAAAAERRRARDEGGVDGTRGRGRHTLSLAEPSVAAQCPALRRVATSPATLRLARAIFGHEAFHYNRCSGDVNAPGCLPYQALHSDLAWGATWYAESPPLVTFMLAPEAVSLEAGPARQIPGTHLHRPPLVSGALHGLMCWMRLHNPTPLRLAVAEAVERAFTALRRLIEGEWADAGFLAVQLPAGGALIRDVRAWHSGTPNTTRASPRALPSVEFAHTWCARGAGGRAAIDEAEASGCPRDFPYGEIFEPQAEIPAEELAGVPFDFCSVFSGAAVLPDPADAKEPLAQPPLQIDDCGSGVLGAFCLGGGRTESPPRARPDGRAASPATNAKHTPPSPGRRVIKAVGGIVRGVGNLVSPRRKRQQ